MKVNGKIINVMDMGFINGVMEMCMKENGRIIS